MGAQLGALLKPLETSRQYGTEGFNEGAQLYPNSAGRRLSRGKLILKGEVGRK